MFTEQLSHESDQPCGGLVAGTGDHRGVRENLGAFEPTTGAVRFFDLRIEQFGHQIVGGMFGPPLDVLGEHRDRFLDDRLTEIALLRTNRDALVVAIADLLLAFLRNAKEIADGPHRHESAEIRDEIEAVGVTKWIQCAHAEFAHQILDRQHATWREDAR